MIMNSFGRYLPKTIHDHETAPREGVRRPHQSGARETDVTRWAGGVPAHTESCGALPSSAGSLAGLIGIDAVLAQPRLEVGHPGPQPPELIRLPSALARRASAGLGHRARAGLGHRARVGFGHRARAALRAGCGFLLDARLLLDELLLRIAPRHRLLEVLDVDG